MSRNILLIQNDPAEAKAVQEALIHSSDGPFQVEWVRSCAEGLKSLTREGKQEKPDTDGIAAVLVDLFLPDSRGFETFDQLFRAAPKIPILVLSTSQDEDIAKLVVQYGAQDYLLKDRLNGYLLLKTLGSVIERAANAEALFEEKERAEVTLNSIADAVVSIDISNNITYLNIVAENMTGWQLDEAMGHSVEDVFKIVDATTHETIQNPMTLAIQQNRAMSLTPNCALVRRDGCEAGIEDSAAPIHDRRGQVTGAVMVFHDVSKTRAQALKMSYQAQHDILTDLPNRALFSDRLSQALVLAQRQKTKLAVLYLDVDHFKHINDSLGHAIGDCLLRSIVQRLLACVRSSDTVSRQGGDEFVILFSEMAHPEDAIVGANKILQALSMPYLIERHDLHITVSIGIAAYPDDGAEAETLMKHADLAMYFAKESGRNNYKFFKSEMNDRAVERQSIETGLRQAVEQKEFVLYYQPKVNLETGAIIGAEALIRWHHPQRGLVSPAQFIPVAEECGIIVPIGRWGLREACRQARAWQYAGLPPVRMAFNISAVELRHKDFIDNVHAILMETGLDTRYLELELTETFLMENSESTAIVLQALKDIGVQLSLDDFGTGYSSLSYLQRFPIDTLKIDQSFVRDITTDSNDASIISAVISMGKNLHMGVIAEGVETKEQLAFLKEKKCPEGQGYYFSRPVAADKFAELLFPAPMKAA